MFRWPYALGRPSGACRPCAAQRVRHDVLCHRVTWLSLQVDCVCDIVFEFVCGFQLFAFAFAAEEAEVREALAKFEVAHCYGHVQSVLFARDA